MNQVMTDIFSSLERAGLKPELCDTPVVYDHRSVCCGRPSLAGDNEERDYCLLPRRLMGSAPEFFINLTGDSMKDIGFDPGDRIRVRTDTAVRDGDIVLASVDGEFTVKVYFSDEQSRHWLLPQNADFLPILLTDEMQVTIVGKVVELVKDSPRLSSTECLKTIRRSLCRLEVPPEARRVEQALRQIAPAVENSRQWYAVFRALCDRKVLAPADFLPFEETVRRLLPDHAHLPVASDLSRLAVQTFRKPVALWDRNNAPVSGKRFDDYRRIALRMAELLA